MPNNTSTTLPTEPGTYLFCGHRRTQDTTIQNLAIHSLRTEMVRVHLMAGGKLNYIGTDFFYHPEEVRGVWLKITNEAEAVQAQAEALLFDEATRIDVPAAMPTWTNSASKEGLISKLIGPFPNIRSTAEKAVDRAIELGSIVPDPKYMGAYVLPEAK